MKRLFTYFTAAFLLISFTAHSKIPSRPVPAKLVNDLAEVLTETERNQLENILVDYANSTTTQVVVLTVPNLDGEDKAVYSFQVMDAWGIGQADKDNGLLILVKPKTAEERGEVFIATGRGLEGAIPDASAKRIVEEDMIPYFKNGDYYNGILNGVNKCLALAEKDFQATEAAPAKDKKEIIGALIGIAAIIIFWIIVASVKTNKYSRTNHIPWWTAFWIMNSGSGRHGGSWGGFSGGGGGFGGFGGGSSGGGGAGGSW